MAVSNTPNIGLNLPSKSEQNWDTLLNQNFDKIDNEINNNNIDIGDKTELQTENKNDLVQATNELVSQMAEKANQADLNATNTSLILKADISYVNTKTQANNLAYKESYNTLALLQAAYPSGDNYNHTVLTDGMIYTWINSSWTSTGIQANGTGIANNSLTENKLSFIPVKGVASKNLFNIENALDNTYLYTDTGTTATNSDYRTSDYISVLPNTQYSTLRVNAVCFYTSAKVFISSVSNSPKNVTTPSNCAYMRFYTWAGWIDKIQIEAGTPTAYEPYGSYLNRTLIPTGFVKSSNNVIVVAKSGGDYSTIMDAVNRAGDSANNPVTILIMPGLYNESVDLRGDRYISLVGVNKNTCIIKNNTGNYLTPPLNIGGNAYIANLTIIATHDNPTLQDGKSFGDIGYLPSYGIHMDDVGEGINEIYNCVIISKHNAAVGMGLHNNQTNIINACELYKQDIGSPYQDSYVYIGALIAHNFQLSGSINQRLIVKHSKILAEYGVALRLVDANHDSGGTADDMKDTIYGFYNNIVFSKTLKKDCVTYTPSPQEGNLAGYIKLAEDSFGNNIIALNAQ
jgi:hypothetical protein